MTHPHYIDRGLLPCPFCGGAASVIQSRRVDTYGEWLAGCDSEQCIPQPEALADTEAEAIAAWNRRPAPIEAVAWREALEEFVRVGEEAKANPAPRDDEFGRGIDAARIEAANEAIQALAVIPTQGGGE